MKKLTLSISIVLLTLTSCTTPDQPTTENNQGQTGTLVVERLWYRRTTTQQWEEQHHAYDRPLQLNNMQYNNCSWVGEVVEQGAVTNSIYDKYRRIIACK
jgi:hypothetical protein